MFLKYRFDPLSHIHIWHESLLFAVLTSVKYERDINSENITNAEIDFETPCMLTGMWGSVPTS